MLASVKKFAKKQLLLSRGEHMATPHTIHHSLGLARLHESKGAGGGNHGGHTNVLASVCVQQARTTTRRTTAV